MENAIMFLFSLKRDEMTIFGTTFRNRWRDIFHYELVIYRMQTRDWPKYCSNPQNKFKIIKRSLDFFRIMECNLTDHSKSVINV